MKHFCTCPVTQCQQHPSNHNDGCDPCIQDNLKKNKMPACFFNIINNDINEVKDYTINGFVDFYLKHNNK